MITDYSVIEQHMPNTATRKRLAKGGRFFWAVWRLSKNKVIPPWDYHDVIGSVAAVIWPYQTYVHAEKNLGLVASVAGIYRGRACFQLGSAVYGEWLDFLRSYISKKPGVLEHKCLELTVKEIMYERK